MVEDGHQHLVVPAPVVHQRFAVAAFLGKPRFLVCGDSGGIERGHAELNAVQAHLAESVVDGDARRVRAVAAAGVLAAQGDAGRRAPVLGARARNPMLPANAGGSPSLSMARPALSFSFALQPAIRSFAAACDSGATRYDSVARPRENVTARCRPGACAGHSVLPGVL